MLVADLSSKLIKSLQSADEIWIAVALINTTGLNLIKRNAPRECVQHYLVGIDLPSEPKALWSLYKDHNARSLTASIYTGKEYYHPKLYLIRKGKTYTAYVGSANCTNGGMTKNIELGLHIAELQLCLELKAWYERMSVHGVPLAEKFLKKYELDYTKRLNRNVEDAQKASSQKRELSEEIMMVEKNAFIQMLLRYRNNTDEYNWVVQDRQKSIDQLRDTLDYPTFNNIDIDGFFDIWALGHIIPLPKPTIKREIRKFRKLLVMLCDDSLDISIRYDNAFTTTYKIRGVADALISKILIIHNPKLYYVRNEKTITGMKKYGLNFNAKLSRGEKYKQICSFLAEICTQTKIKNLAVLDFYLYTEGGAK